MMRLPTVLFGPLLLMAACSSVSPTQNLNARLQARLSPDIAAGHATLQPLPDGTQVLVIDQALFTAGGTELDDNGRFVLASVIQGLLDPRLMRIDIAASPGTPPYLQAARAQSVTRYFVDYGLGQTLVPPAVPVGAAPPGTSIGIHVASN